MLRLRPYINSVKRRIKASVSLSGASARVDVIAPASKSHFDALLALPDEKERVSKTIANHDVALHLRFFEPQDMQHVPVLRFELHDALVVFNGVFAQNGTFNRAGPLDHHDILRGPIVPLEQAAYCLEDRSYFFFGHWMRSFAQCLLAEPDMPLLHFAPKTWTHAPKYEDVFGLPSLAPAQYHVSKLLMFQDFSQSVHKARRYQTLRDRLHSRIAPAPGARRNVYLKRGRTGAARLIANEADLERTLVDMGFDIVDLATETIDDIMAKCVGAEIALTIEGSHADHLHWLLKPGGTLWILNPSDHFNTSQFGVAQSMGNRTACSVILPTGVAKYTVDLARLQATYNLILK